MSEVPKTLPPEPLKLTPELHARLYRMALARKQTMTRVLCDIVGEEWVRFACRSGLRPEEM